MADSSMAIDSTKITNFANGDALTETDLDTTVGEIVEKFDAMLETSTGHDHDGTNSKAIGSGFAGLSTSEYVIAIAGGLYD